MNKRKNTGFTLIELLVVIAIISLLSSMIMASLASARQKSRAAKRIDDMKTIQTALEMYYNDNKGYPVASSWTSECAAFGGVSANNVIPGLVPTYLGKMPSDPTMSITGNTSCYVYASDGVDYALLDFNVPDLNYMSQPSLVDTARDGGTNCATLDGSVITAWKVRSSPASTCW